LWRGYKKPPQGLKDAKNRQGFLSAQVGVVTSLVTGVMCISPINDLPALAYNSGLAWKAKEMLEMSWSQLGQEVPSGSRDLLNSPHECSFSE